MTSLSPDIYRQVVESLPVGIYVVGRDRRIVFWNREAERVTGYLAQEVIGRSCQDDILAHCEAHGTSLCRSNGCLLTCALREKHSTEVFLFARHKDGHRIPIYAKSIPLCDEEGNVIGIAEMFSQPSSVLGAHPYAAGHDTNDGLNIPSFAATQAYLQSRFEAQAESAIFVIEIEDIDGMGRQRGLEMVHASMRALVNTLSDLLTMPHYLGRWRGQSFLIALPSPNRTVIEELHAQLHGIGNSLTVQWWGDRIACNVIVKNILVRDMASLQELLGEAVSAQEEGR